MLKAETAHTTHAIAHVDDVIVHTEVAIAHIEDEIAHTAYATAHMTPTNHACRHL